LAALALGITWIALQDGGSGLSASFDERLVAAADDLARAHSELFAGFRPLDVDELTSPGLGPVRGGRFRIVHPAGVVLSERPALEFEAHLGAVTYDVNVTSTPDGTSLGTAKVTASDPRASVITCPWPLAADLPRGVTVILTVRATGAAGDAQTKKVFKVATADEEASWSKAKEAIAGQIADPSLRHGLLAHLALRRRFYQEAEEAVRSWLLAVRDDPHARAVQGYVDRLLRAGS
jgi:hypothetical protein